MDSKKELEIIDCEVCGETFSLHPFMGMFWEQESILFVSDTHFGKVSHFRKEGIAVPMGAIEKNWTRLAEMINSFSAKRVIILGDLFHSAHNNEWNSFISFMNSFAEIDFSLVLGNHDILDHSYYEEADLTLYSTLEIGPFIFTHEPIEESTELYNIYGHIHPAVIMKGHGRQSLRLACFYFGTQHGIMPAFGSFTGKANIAVKDGDQIFVIAEEKVVKVS